MDITLGHDKDKIRIGDLVLIFKVTAEKNRSNLSVCGGGHLFSLKTNLELLEGGMSVT